MRRGNPAPAGITIPPPRLDGDGPTVCTCADPDPRPIGLFPGAVQCAKCSRPPLSSLTLTR